MPNRTMNRRVFSIGVGASAIATALNASSAQAQTEEVTSAMLDEGIVVLKMDGSTVYAIETAKYYGIDLETADGRVSMYDWLAAAAESGFRPQSDQFLMTSSAENLPDISETNLEILKTGASMVLDGTRAYMCALDWYYCEVR